MSPTQLVGQHAAPAGQVPEDGRQEVQVRVGQRLPEVRDLAHLPEQPHPLRPVGPGPDLVAPGEEGEAAVVQRVAHLHQAPATGGARSRLAESASRLAKSSSVLRQRSALERREAVALDRLDLLLVEGAAAAGGTERAVRHVPAGAAGDLRDLGMGQPALLAAVELAQGLAKATWAMSMLRPMPMASVATRWSTSPAW